MVTKDLLLHRDGLRYELSNCRMKPLEQWVLRVADSNATWCGLNWLRPAKHQHIGPAYILLSSILLGLPGIAAGGGLIYLAFGRVEPRVWMWMIALVMMVELPLHMLFAHFWNRRAARLMQDSSIP